MARSCGNDRVQPRLRRTASFHDARNRSRVPAVIRGSKVRATRRAADTSSADA
jgi:hypothetical protein